MMKSSQFINKKNKKLINLSEISFNKIILKYKALNQIMRLNRKKLKLKAN